MTTDIDKEKAAEIKRILGTKDYYEIL